MSANATPRQQFSSDNNAGLCPAALDALIAANAGHAPAYGADEYTRRATDLVRRVFETDCAVRFVFTGTAANALILAHFAASWHAIVAHAWSHVEEDETGAPGFFSGGAKMLVAETPDAKLTPAAVERFTTRPVRVHNVRPTVLSLTQATEAGTVYTPDEIRALTAVARRHGLRVHMDGARFANAVASLDVRPADITWRAGVDALAFGGVKNGLGAGEAVVFFDKALVGEFDWRMKQAGQLNSKMRLVTAPWCAMLEQDRWLANARHANAMARRLGDGLSALGVRLAHPVEANGVFALFSPATQDVLRARGWQFHTFDPPDTCRLMCAWDTAADTVDRLLTDAAAALGR